MGIVQNFHFPALELHSARNCSAANNKLPMAKEPKSWMQVTVNEGVQGSGSTPRSFEEDDRKERSPFPLSLLDWAYLQNLSAPRKYQQGKKEYIINFLTHSIFSYFLSLFATFSTHPYNLLSSLCVTGTPFTFRMRDRAASKSLDFLFYIAFGTLGTLIIELGFYCLFQYQWLSYFF